MPKEITKYIITLSDEVIKDLGYDPSSYTDNEIKEIALKVRKDLYDEYISVLDEYLSAYSK